MEENTGKSKGGFALAKKMSEEDRKAKSLAMVEAKKSRKAMPRVIKKRDNLNIADVEIPCAIIQDNAGNPVRILTEYGIMNALSSEASGASKRRKKALENEGELVPIFLTPRRLEPFIESLNEDKNLLNKISYLDGEKIMQGYDARVLPVICDIWLKAREAGVLKEPQLAKKAQKAEILMRGLAHVGIIALVDEATGYQKDREKNALAKILEAFVAKELQPYLKTFPTEYYEHLFRIYDLPFPPQNKKPQWRPAFFGKITNNVIYDRLAPELLPELKKSASKFEKKTKLHQWLTSDVGHPKLREHLSSIVTLLKLSKTPQDFKDKVDLIHPRLGSNLSFEFDETS